MKYTCPCCGYKTLDGKNEYDICPICFWEDDWYQLQNPFSDEGANHISLFEAQINFRRYGACDEQSVKSVRKPNVIDEFDLSWRPLKTISQSFLNWINQNTTYLHDKGILTEEIKVVADNTTDNPSVTVYHYNQHNRIGIITVWESNMVYFEVQDCNNGDTLTVENRKIEGQPVFEEIFKDYISLLQDSL